MTRQRILQWLKTVLTACVQGTTASNRLLKCMEAASVADIHAGFERSGLVELRKPTPSEAVADLRVFAQSDVAATLLPAVSWAADVMYSKESHPPSSKKAQQLAETVFLNAAVAVYNLAQTVARHPSPQADAVFQQLMPPAKQSGMTASTYCLPSSGKFDMCRSVVAVIAAACSPAGVLKGLSDRSCTMNRATADNLLASYMSSVC